MTTHQEVRKYLLDELKKDLVGPGKIDEELTDAPTTQYLTGILYPGQSTLEREQDEDANQGTSDDDDEQDTGTLIAGSFNPTSIGLTFIVNKGETFNVQTRAARYRPEKDNTTGSNIWKRYEPEIKPVRHTADQSLVKNTEVCPDLNLQVRVRMREDFAVVTVSLVNTQIQEENSGNSPELCFFQPEIEIEAEDGKKPIFLARHILRSSLHEPDRDLYELLYRHAPEYAVGHGCAADWDETAGQSGTRIRTTIIPAYELLQISPEVRQSFRAQEMKFLAAAGKGELVKELRKLSSTYMDWIQTREKEIPGLTKRLQSTGTKNMENCRQVQKRIEEGISLLEKDAAVREAFQLANQAMLIQRARITWMKLKPEDRPKKPELSPVHRWWPFQLAFMLMCLPSIADPSDTARSLVDLLWFPTGGGKTEAYLGLTAFTIFLRRFKSPINGDGVTVLMRYTLRLLTIQQFQRASTLIMACETIRRGMPGRLGKEPINIGLWVGGGATPNWLKNAKGALEQLLEGERVLEGNPFQILSCPWCGTKLTPRDYRIAVSMTIQCPNDDCDFKAGMPLYLVDEDIYFQRPSLLIGTVDKFARMPWAGQVSEIFGRGASPKLPPELIIQDELHLISGPLGTLVGLYETAIDILCEYRGIPPKVIASTATIRRAGEQCKSLFNRGLEQFPPAALDARDSFFAREIPGDEKPGRLYAGVYAPGKSMKTALLRIYANLLQKISEHASDKDIRDAYWTLIGYFNSIRELGGAVRLVEDDVRERIGVLANRNKTKARQIECIEELNSRVGSDEIPQRLEAMAFKMDEPGALDVLLATNMISVGVDIDRLALMVVTGQPKMSSEYIQATSRIGRQHAGLVVTLCNWTRPRDRSHYERFRGFHSAIYSHVEPTSVTPFASRARDRGLHGIFISLVRHLVQGMNPEEAAFRFSPDAPEVRKIIDLIVERVKAVDPGEAVETRMELEKICNHWNLMSGAGELNYGPAYHNPNLAHLMHQSEKLADEPLSLPTLNSLRDVEGQSGLFAMPRRRI